MPRFAIGEKDFLLDGQPFRILSGAIHYFRVHPEHWADRIRKAKLMGLNTIETYVAWNFHEPTRGEWRDDGWRDLGRFLDLVAAEGMYAIVRPGPYICAEWHNGGLPAWLTSMEGIALRRSDERYLTELRRFLDRVYRILAPRQIEHGGPVLLVQIENEYGAYGDDADYLRELVRMTRAAGIDVPLTTVDQPTPQMLRDGSLPELHKTGSFGSQVSTRLTTLREHQPTGPLMCSEYWDGWFDWWGGMHHTTDVASAAEGLDALLAAGASVNIYMFHGGTNFGATNGANHKGRYLPLVTSYDYDAPLNEAGHPTEKYWAFRDVIAKYAHVPAEQPAPAAPTPAFDVELTADGDWTTGGTAITTSGTTIAGRTATPPAADEPPSFDELGHTGPFVRYTAELPRVPSSSLLLHAGDVRDIAHVTVDGVRVGTLSRTLGETAIRVPAGRRVDILVEELGRVNYGPLLGEAKGLVGGVQANGSPLTGWTATPLDLDAAAHGHGVTSDPAQAETRFVGRFTLDAPSDLHLDTGGWSRGFVFLNGVNLGRYWSNGPQRTLYVPGPLTRAGENEIVVLDVSGLVDPLARFVAEPRLGPVEE